MKTSRSELREKIMVILYQSYLYQKDNIEYDINNVIKENCEFKSEFVNSIVFGVVERQEKLNELVNKYMKDWTIDRLGAIDKAILSIGTYELLYTDTPSIVCINEAIELSKKYSDEKVTKLINAVLDSILDNEVKDE